MAAARIAARERGEGERWDAAGSAAHPCQHACLGEVGRAAGPCARLHVNAGPGGILRVLAGARAYLHASKETFGIAAAEAVAAGCVPVVPDSSAHAETVPFAGLRDHVQRFSEAAFPERMLGIIEGRE